MSLDTLSRVGGGISTTRLGEADERYRAKQAAAAHRWLTERGHEDLLPMLGLAPATCSNCNQEIQRHAKSRGLCPSCRRKARDTAKR